MDSKNNQSSHADFEAVRQEVEQEMRDEFGAEGLVDPGLEELEDLSTELGMREVQLDQAVIDTVAADDVDNTFDTDNDGIEDDIDRDEIVDDRPQELTESYGTGLQGQPSDRAGTYSRWSDHHLFNNPDPMLTGGDIDANYEQAAVVGDESVGGTVATPDQDVVEELAAAVGVELDDRSFLRVNEMLEQRDDRRWELDPKSSEDYTDRRDDESV